MEEAIVNEYKYNNMNSEKRAETNLVAYGNSFITVNSFLLSLSLFHKISSFIVERSCKFTKSYLTAHSRECSLPYCSLNLTRVM